MPMKTAGQSLTEQRADRFAERIRTRRLAPGALFHARRQASTLMHIHVATTPDARVWRDVRAVRDGA